MRPRYSALPHPADACPDVVNPDHRDGAVVPYFAEEVGPAAYWPLSRQVRCWYRCPDCFRSWTCEWNPCALDSADPHFYPDCHDAGDCPCGCGMVLLRPAPRKENAA